MKLNSVVISKFGYYCQPSRNGEALLSTQLVIVPT